MLSDDEEVALFAKLRGRRSHVARIVRFALETGLRRGELLALGVEHVNLSTEPRYFTIGGKRIEIGPGELIVVRGKNGEPGVIPLSAEARRIAEAQVSDETTKQFLFTSFRTGKQFVEIKTAFRAAVEDAGLQDFRFHDLRHTFSSRLNEAGIDMCTVRDLMRHKGTQMTADYTHSRIQHRRDAVARLGERLRNYGRITASGLDSERAAAVNS